MMGLLLETTVRTMRVVSYCVPTNSLPYNQTIVVPLRPSHIKPDSDGQHDLNLRFVAPEDMKDLNEGDLLPYEAARRRIPRGTVMIESTDGF